jgi:hypothetical protein
VRYRQADRRAKGQILDEFCEVTGHHRKAAIRMLRVPLDRARPRRGRGRTAVYSARTIQVLVAIWTAAGYPWSVRLNALLPHWLPWARRRFALTATVEAELARISPRQVPYPLGFYAKGLDGRIDDPNGGWKGRGLWAANGDRTPWLIEGGKGTKPLAAHFQLRPDPLAK